MQAIIIARVSTKEQEEGHSVQAQIGRLEEYCQRRELKVLKTFTIIESSTRGERHEFNAMLDFAKKQNGVTAVVADAVDRVQRSFKDSVILDELIRREKIELHFYREGMIIGKNASSTDIMRWDFSVMGAKSYVLQLAENVKRSIEWKLKNGEVVGHVPIGYLNARDSITGKSIVLVDEGKAPLVIRLFNNYATGAYTIGEMVKEINLWGMRTRTGKPVGKSHLHTMLQNRFYYGEMENKGRIFPHIYPTLIPRSIYEKCQEVRLGWNKKPFRYSEKPFIFRGLIKCSVTGNLVSSDLKKDKYIYLIATDPTTKKKIWIKEEAVLNQIADVFKRIKIPQDILQHIRTHLRDGYESEKHFHKISVTSIQRELALLDAKIDKLTDLLIDGHITPEDHKRKRTDITDKKHDLKIQLEGHEMGDDAFRETLEGILYITSRAHDIFLSSNSEKKRALINLVFSNLELKGREVQFSLHSPFHLFTEPTDRPSWLALVDTIRTNPELRQSIISLNFNPASFSEVAHG